MRSWARQLVSGVCGVLVAATMTGCGGDPGSGAGAGAASPVGPKPTRWPAAMAGGACQLLDYTVVEQVVGLAFDVSATGRQDATYTCALGRTGQPLPDLTLAVTPTGADATVFRSVVMPKGASVLTGLGKVGYRMVVPAAADAKRGPGVEVGWLSGNNRIIVLRCTLAMDAPPTAADELAPKVAELAQRVDKASV